MTTKKKLGSKLAHSVRQVKTQREQSSTAADNTVAVKKPANKSVAAHATAKSAAPRATKTTDSKGFRPNRVWPD